MKLTKEGLPSTFREPLATDTFSPVEKVFRLAVCVDGRFTTMSPPSRFSLASS